MNEGVRAFEAPTDAPSEAPVKRYEILGYDEMFITHIAANRHNPRPSFHLSDADQGLIALGDSIRVEGQHRPALAFEQIGHYELPDRPGHFVLLQGERRWRACGIARVDTLRILKVRTPKTLAEELEWLGIEEAFKQDWQYFFVLQFANRLAIELGIPITSPEITTKTGLEQEDLRTAEKIFKLDPAIQDLVAEYEEIEYQSRQARARGVRATGSKSREFSAKKAALVWDICEALKANFPQIVKNVAATELDLQMRMTAKATHQRATFDELENLLRHIRESGANPGPGLLTEIAELLEKPQRKIRDALRASGNGNVGKYRKLISRLDAIQPTVRQMTAHLAQIGNDPAQLQADLNIVLRLRADLVDLERGIEVQRSKFA